MKTKQNSPPLDAVLAIQASIRARAEDDPVIQRKNAHVLRLVLDWYVGKAGDEGHAQIQVADTWVAEQLSRLNGRKVPRQHVWAARHRLDDLGYIRILEPEQVTRADLIRTTNEYKRVGRKPPTVVEMQCQSQSTT